MGSRRRVLYYRAEEYSRTGQTIEKYIVTAKLERSMICKIACRDDPQGDGLSEQWLLSDLTMTAWQ